MKQKVFQHKFQILILLAIFVVYLLVGIGALNISIQAGIDINFNPRIFASAFSKMFIQSPSKDSLGLLLMLATGLVLCVGLPLLTPFYAAVITLLSSIPQIFIYSSAIDTRLILPFEYNFLIILILFSMNALIIYFIETHSRVEIVNLFGQYVPPEIVSELCRKPNSINMDGEARRMTVVFCDLQDFTGIAEQLDPKSVTHLLNEYFDNMTEILYRHGATIDKYIGDAIMAFWGAPLVQDDHAQRSVLAAFEMQEQILALSQNLIQRGLPGPLMGIGINTGEMNVGNMGSRYRMVYTVIGDAVNLASRIETLTRFYKVPTLVSESTMSECRNILFREIDTVQVKGKQNHTRIYQPVCSVANIDGKTESLILRHQQGIEAYNKQDFNAAKRIFLNLREDCVDDNYYPVILDKINHL